jgi:hypothetical protein
MYYMPINCLSATAAAAASDGSTCQTEGNTIKLQGQPCKGRWREYACNAVGRWREYACNAVEIFSSWCVHVLTSQDMIMLAFYHQLAADW